MIVRTSLFLIASLLLNPSIALTAAPEPKHLVVDIVSISGEEFVVKDETGKEDKIHVGSDTQTFGRLQPGDRIDAWVMPNGHAKTVMILRSGAVIQAEREQQRQRESQQRTEGQQSVSSTEPAR